MGLSVLKLVAQAFETGEFDRDINSTFLILIPKIDELEKIKQFRPISLYKVIYKTTNKVLVYRMKPILGKIIHPLQASFIPGNKWWII